MLQFIFLADGLDKVKVARVYCDTEKIERKLGVI